VRRAEADRLAALKQAEDARREAEAARAEQQRLAKLASDAVASQKATSVIAPVPQEEQPPVAANPLYDSHADQIKLALTLQTELKRVGCDPGEIDGRWGAKAKDPLANFARLAKKTLPSDLPGALQAVLGQKGRICPPTCANKNERDDRCIAARKIEKIPTPQQYDGNWTVTWRSGNCPVCTGSHTIVIVNGAIASGGHLSAGGAATWQGTVAGGTFRGNFHGNSASGTFHNPRFGTRRNSTFGVGSASWLRTHGYPTAARLHREACYRRGASGEILTMGRSLLCRGR
jgi:hypothetical protein